MTHVDEILTFFDTDFTPYEISIALSLPLAKVYRVLRLHRPDRPRTPRRRTSLVRPKALALHAEGLSIAKIAALCQVDEAWVYRLVAETRVHRLIAELQPEL